MGIVLTAAACASTQPASMAGLRFVPATAPESAGYVRASMLAVVEDPYRIHDEVDLLAWQATDYGGVALVGIEFSIPTALHGEPLECAVFVGPTAEVARWEAMKPADPALSAMASRRLPLDRRKTVTRCDRVPKGGNVNRPPNEVASECHKYRRGKVFQVPSAFFGTVLTWIWTDEPKPWRGALRASSPRCHRVTSEARAELNPEVRLHMWKLKPPVSRPEPARPAARP